MLTILSFDARNLIRDRLLFNLVCVMTFVVIGLSAAGIFRQELGIADFAPWVPYLIILFLITNPGTYGLMFGLGLVEEVETQVRQALLLTPVNAVMLIGLRTLVVLVWLIAQGWAFAVCVSTAWGVTALGSVNWLTLSILVSPLGAVLMILTATFAKNRIEALAMGKAFSVATAPAILSYLVPDQSWFKTLFWIFPTTATVEVFNAIKDESETHATIWISIGSVYVTALILIVSGIYIHQTYRFSKYG